MTTLTGEARRDRKSSDLGWAIRSVIFGLGLCGLLVGLWVVPDSDLAVHDWAAPTPQAIELAEPAGPQPKGEVEELLDDPAPIDRSVNRVLPPQQEPGSKR